MNVGFAWRVIHARHLVPVKVGLLDDPVFGCDLSEVGQTSGKGCGSFELLKSHLRIDDGAGIDRGVHSSDLHFAVLVHLYLHNRGDIGEEAAMDRQTHAEAVAIFPFAPASLVGRDFKYPPKSRRIDWVSGVITVVVRVVLRKLGLRDYAIWAEQRENVVPRIFASGAREFVGKGVFGEGVENVADT